MEDVVYENCSVHLTVVPDKEMAIPRGLKFNRFQEIHILIDYYEGDDELMRFIGMEQLIKLLTYGGPNKMPDIRIEFRESRSMRAIVHGDPKWTQKVPFDSTFRWHNALDLSDDEDNNIRRQNRSRCCSYSEDDTSGSDSSSSYEPGDTWLLTGRRWGNPFAIDILDYFLDLLLCESVLVKPLRTLEARSGHLPRHDIRDRILDGKYMMDCCNALKYWLTGDRDGVLLPRSTSDDGQPRLEQLAYARYREGYYCVLQNDNDDEET